MGHQVRLDPDVADALAALARQEGGSVSLWANRQLRAALGLSLTADSEPPPTRAAVASAASRVLRMPRR